MPFSLWWKWSDTTTTGWSTNHDWGTNYGGNSTQGYWARSPQTHPAPESLTPKARDRANLEALRAQEVKRRRSFKAPVVIRKRK
jgi:hypothetical protein